MERRHLDTDDFFWLPSDPPFQHVRPRDERGARLGAALRSQSRWVLSGCLCGWGDGFIRLFDLVVFLWLPHDARLARLRARERERYIHRAVQERVAVEWGPEVYWYGRREFGFRHPDGYLVIISERTDAPPTCAEA